MIKVEYEESLEILEIYEPRLTCWRFKRLVEWTIMNAMENDSRNELAKVTINDNTVYYFCVDTWMEGSRVFGELNVFKDFNELPIYTKDYILAD